MLTQYTVCYYNPRNSRDEICYANFQDEPYQAESLEDAKQFAEQLTKLFPGSAYGVFKLERIV